MPTLRTIITPQKRNIPIALAQAATTATSQPMPAMAPIWEILTRRRTAVDMSVPDALNSPSDSASTTSRATVVKAMAQNANSTPEAVPVTAWVRAWPSRLMAARTSWAQNVATSRSRPMGRIVS